MGAKVNPPGLVQRLRRAACAGLLCLTIAACAGQVAPPPPATGEAGAPSTPTPFQPPTDAPLPDPTATLIPSPTATPLPTPTALPAVRPAYALQAVLDYAAHSLKVDESILYPNAGDAALPELVLAVEADRWVGCFSLGAIQVDGQAARSARLNGIRLEVPLATPLSPGGSVRLALHYTLQLPEADIHQVFGWNAAQADMVDWYPFVVPYVDGQGWLLHEPGQFGEHLVYDEADFDVTLQPSDPGLGVVFAASAPGEQEAGAWHYRLERARTFVFSASPDYRTASQSVGTATVTSYFFPSERNAAQAVLQAVALAVATYAGRFGAFPYPSLSVVEAVFDDGMEYDGLFLLSRGFYIAYNGTPLNYLIAIGVHETAHQWWFGLVGNDQALEPWLDEAMATYSEEIFYETNYPGVTAWWSFRVDAYDPTGWVDTDIYHAGRLRPYINAVYLRGARFLQALRERIGDEAFFAFLKDYAAEMGGKRATADDFFRILRRHSQVDFSDLEQAYFQVQH